MGIVVRSLDGQGGSASNGGSAAAGGSAGGSASSLSPVTLGDAYASSLFAQALTRQREAIINLGEGPVKWELTPKRENVNDHAHAKYWEPWVRSYLVAQDLIRSTDFIVDGPGEKDDQKPFSVELRVRPNPTGNWLRAAKIINPSRKVFEGQVAKVLQWAELREERTPEILTQIDRQDAFWGSIIPIQTNRLTATRELIDAAIQFAVFVGMRFKHELACWRPTDYSAQVQPMITTPGHGSLPCGHCTQSYVVFEVMKALLNSRQREEGPASLNLQLERVAARISTNRLVAGVHFPVDNVAGRLLGTVLGEYFVHYATPVPPREANPSAEEKKKKPRRHFGWTARTFDGGEYSEDEDFDPFHQFLVTGYGRVPRYYTDFVEYPPATQTAPVSNVLQELWRSAEDEVNELGLCFGDPDK